MVNPKVSIVTPSLNQGEYIEYTILSVLNQTYQNIEYIVVDGGSNDETLEVLSKYSSKLKLILGQDNGQTDAINIGMKASTGDLVGWVNSDDLLMRDAVANVVEAFGNNPNGSVYYGGVTLIDDRNRVIGFPKLGLLTFENLLYGKPSLIQVGTFYPKLLIEKVGYLDDNLLLAMDVDLFLKLLKFADAILIPKILSSVRIHKSSKTSRFRFLHIKESVLIRLRNGIPLPRLLIYIINRIFYIAKLYFTSGKLAQKF